MTKGPDSDVSEIIEPIFRQLSGQLIATLARILGAHNIDDAEAIVQDAFLKACEVWPYKGIPENPSGWITTVAKNLAIDNIRKRARIEALTSTVTKYIEDQIVEHLTASDRTKDMFLDDQLQMMLLTCHPILSRRSKVMLTLRLVGGLSVREIAAAFLSNEESARKLITRAKLSLREIENPFTWPDDNEIEGRLEVVMEVLYSIFNKGYSLSDDEVKIRAELCDDAIRLTLLLLNGSRDVPSRHSVSALLALMLLHSSRIPARIDVSNSLVLLAEQDRSSWDTYRIGEGLRFLRQSFGGNKLTVYHLEAQIAAAHAVAKDYESTEWDMIVNLYDQLYKMTENPVIGLNRAVAIAEARGVRAGLKAINELRAGDRLSNYYLYFATLADFHRRAGNNPLAIINYRLALPLVSNDLERRFILKRIEEVSAS